MDQSSGGSFTSMVAEGRKIPAGIDSDKAIEAPGFFSETRGPVTRDSGAEKLGAETECVSFSKVFLLWRPWNECARCMREINAGTITLPETGDHTCPHNQGDEYKRTVDRCLRGDGILQSRNYFNLKDGTRCVHIEWLEYDASYLRQLQKKEEIKKKHHVWPPDPEAAFAEEKIKREP